jgi:hypothetical protein
MQTALRGKELKLNILTNQKVNFGTINSKLPKSVYVEIKGWVAPVSNNPDINYNQIVRKLNKEIKSELFKILDSEVFNPNVYIVDLDLRDSGIQYGKRSFYNCEITLYQNNQIKDLKELTPNIKELVNHIVTNVFDNFKHFTFHKNKK